MMDAFIIGMMLKDKPPYPCEERKMEPLPRVCIICKERVGNDFLSEAIWGCVQTVSEDYETKLDENDLFRSVEHKGETIRVVYKDCDSCSGYDNCTIREVTPTDYTTGYCNQCSKK